jgi:hypothetical protein
MTDVITAIDLRGSKQESNIAAYYVDGKGWKLKANYISEIRNQNLQVRSRSLSGPRVEIVNAQPPYLRSDPNSTSSDNLLSLPDLVSGLV